MEYLLSVEVGDQSGEEFLIEEGEMIVGRSESATFVLRDSHVSRRHLRLVRTGDEIVIENLSRFGTLVDGRSLNEPELLSPGQRIELPLVIT